MEMISMSKFTRFLCAFVLLAVFAFPAFSHELILKPTKMDGATGKLAVELHSTHRFILSEEVEDISYIEAGVVRDGKIIKSQLAGNDPGLRIDFSVKLDASEAAIIAAQKVGFVWSVTNEGGKSGARGALEKSGLKVLSSTRYDKYAKAIVNASGGDENFGAVLGQDLEIVPIDNPATTKVGEYMRVRIIRMGQPVSTQVWATYDGFCTEHDSTYAFYTESGADGVAHIKITNPGLWMVRTIWEKEPGVAGEFDSRSLRSTLVFSVK